MTLTVKDVTPFAPYTHVKIVTKAKITNSVCHLKDAVTASSSTKYV